MDMENMNNVGSQAKGACKKYWKKGLAAVVALALLGGAGAAWDIQREHSERAAKDAARSQLVAAQAAREDITLISEDEAKAKAAEAVGMDESALTFDRVGLENLAQQKDGKDKKDKKDKKERKDGERPSLAALHEGHDNRGHGYENHDGDDHDRYEHDGQQGMGQPGAPQMMMQGATQGQPPMMDGQQPPQGAPMAQAAQNTDGTQPQPPMQPQAAAQGESDSATAQTQNQRPHFGFHPAYKVACEHGGVKYHVLVDATNGNVMMCDVA